MNKLNLLNLVLFIVVISLAFVIYFSEVEDTRLQPLTDIDPNNVSLIKIQRNKNITLIHKQGNKFWQITQPVSVAANNFRISSILELLNAPIHNQYAISEIDLEKTGLHKPETSIQFDETTIHFGIINTATNLRYIRINETIYTIEDVYYPLLNSHFSTLVSLNLLEPDSSIEKLILINQTIDKDDNGLWRSTIDISADSIVKTLDHWKKNQAFGVHEYIPRDELGKVSVYIKDQPQAIDFIITDTAPWLVIARPELGLEYHLDIEAYDQLVSPVDDDNNTKQTR